jgi:hypothetical protein
MRERMRKKEEMDRLLAQASRLGGSETESDETDGSEEDCTDYRQEIQQFKTRQQIIQLKKRMSASTKNGSVGEFKKQCEEVKNMAGGGCAKRRDAKFDIKFEMARNEALKRI